MRNGLAEKRKAPFPLRELGLWLAAIANVEIKRNEHIMANHNVWLFSEYKQAYLRELILF